MSQDRDGVFDIAICGQTLCGRLVGERFPTGQAGGTRRAPKCGLMMLTGFVRDRDDPQRWTGTILDPRSDRHYHAQIWSPAPGLLKLRGYVLMPLFGETSLWTRYDGTIGPHCHLPGPG